MLTRNMDRVGDEVTTKYFPMNKGDKEISKIWQNEFKAGKGRLAGVIVGGGGVVRFSAKTNERKGINSGIHPSDVILG